MAAPLIRLADRIRNSTSPVAAIDPVLYDRAHTPTLTATFLGVRDALMRDVPVIVGDAISEWYYNGTDQERWDLDRDFPGLIPPFPQFWIEWVRPSMVRSREFGLVRADHSALPLTGIIVTIHRPDAPEPAFWRGASNLDAAKVASWQDFCAGARWIWEIHPIGLMEPNFIVTQGFYILSVDGEGKHLHHLSVMSGDAADTYMFSESAPMLCYPGLMSIVFMNLKNGALTPPVLHAPEKFAKHYQRKHELPLVRFHTVVVDPGRTGKPVFSGERTDRTMPIHLVRGHIAQYADEDGKRLFGKYHGSFFRPPHTRGSAKEGVSIHDYKVVTPQDRPRRH